jgi:hypothetical protein
LPETLKYPPIINEVEVKLLPTTVPVVDKLEPVKFVPLMLPVALMFPVALMLPPVFIFVPVTSPVVLIWPPVRTLPPVMLPDVL